MKILCIIFFLFLILSIIPAALWAGCEPIAEAPSKPPGDESDTEPPGEVSDFIAKSGMEMRS